jgi:hypothetical protein
MVHEHYDFSRNPVVKEQAFFLESRCVRCGFTVLAPSIEELTEQEQTHRTVCVINARRIVVNP